MKADQEADFRSFVEAAIPRLRRLAMATSRDPHRADDLASFIDGLTTALDEFEAELSAFEVANG